jgi:uncharacterized protein YqgV (UPF0045/DUF77 family)
VPVPPAELSVTVSGDAARRAAAATGLAHDAGPDATLLAGPRGEVLAALVTVVEAALDEGARRLDVRIEAPTEARG